MSRIDTLIRRTCPNGVERKALSDIGELVRGNGLPKTDFRDSGVGAIHYGQIYTYYGTWTTDTISFVAPETAARLTKVEPGDLIITNTSENLEDVGKAVAWLGDQQIVTGGHATVLKHDQDPKFIAYWLQSQGFQTQKKKYATGTKVTDVSAKSLAKIMIPVPPVEIQREIVRVLDSYSALGMELEAELKAELEIRRRQYAHYRSLLLTFGDDVERKKLHQVADVRAGWGFPVRHQGLEAGQFPFYKVSDMNLAGNEVSMTVANNYVSAETARSLGAKPAPAGTVVFPKIGAAIATNKKRILTKPSCYDNNVFGVIPSDALNPRFLLYHFQSINLSNLAHDSGAVPSIRKTELDEYEIPLPSRAEQDRIVAILDRFNALTNELSDGLPAELRARRTQYEYYRDKLLAFKEMSV